MRKIIKDITQISDRWEKADNGQISILPIYEALETAGLRPQPGDLATVLMWTVFLINGIIMLIKWLKDSKKSVAVEE